MIFRARLEELMLLVFPRAANETARIKSLAKRANLGPETIRTALKGERNPTLTVIEQIAGGLGVSLQQLFSPVPIEFLPSAPGRGKPEGQRPQ